MTVLCRALTGRMEGGPGHCKGPLSRQRSREPSGEPFAEPCGPPLCSVVSPVEPGHPRWRLRVRTSSHVLTDSLGEGAYAESMATEADASRAPKGACDHPRPLINTWPVGEGRIPGPASAVAYGALSTRTRARPLLPPRE